MTKLKPCPFCGSKAKMERTPINPYYYVICTNLECDATVGRFQPTEEEAVAVWNRRDGEQIMKTVIATIIEKNEYRIKIDVENDATEDEIWDAVEEVYWKDDYNNMAKVDSNYNIKIKNSR